MDGCSKMSFLRTSKSGKPIHFRYPTILDAERMCDYINALSKEKTFIRFQGEEMSLEAEKSYLQGELEKIKQRQAVMLLAFHENTLIGISGIEMSDKTERHIGLFGISIAKEFRGDGIGALLMQHILDEAVKALPALEIVTLYFFSHNHVGHKLYKKFGFQQYGLLPQGTKLADSYADHVMMYKRVKPIEEKKRPGFGWMKDTAHVKDDITKPIDEV